MEATAVEDTEPTDQTWEKHKRLITTLYTSWSLEEVQGHLEQHHGFRASKDMFKRKLQKWGITKYATSNKMDRVVESLKRTNERELTQPCPDKEMVVEGQKVTLSQVKRYMRRKNISVTSQSDTNDDVLKRWEGRSNPGLRSDHPGQLLDSYAAMGRTPEDHSQDSGQLDSFYNSEGDGNCGQRKRKNQKVDDSACGTPQLLACPFHKMDPLRYSELNEREKEYRHCSSGYWPDISRLKQHLNRIHRRPESYCPRCYMTFDKESDLDSHCRQQTPCELQSGRKFQEKINDEQMVEIRKKRPGASVGDCWRAIFKILFPNIDIPNSPYIGTSEHEMQRNLYDHFCREAPRILSSLLQPHFQPLSVLDQDSLDRICQETANLVVQLLPRRLQLNTTYSEEAGSSNIFLLANHEPNQSQPLSDVNGHLWPVHSGPDFHQPLYTTQPDLEEQIYDIVGQHAFSWGNSPLPHHTHPDHVYS